MQIRLFTWHQGRQLQAKLCLPTVPSWHLLQCWCDSSCHSAPAWFTALTESPPPMTVVAPCNHQTCVFSLTAFPTKSLVWATTEAIQMQAERNAIDRESSTKREKKTTACENLCDHFSHVQFQMTTCCLEADPLQFHAKAGTHTMYIIPATLTLSTCSWDSSTIPEANLLLRLLETTTSMRQDVWQESEALP